MTTDPNVRPRYAPKVCPYGCRYYNDGWHMENCPGPPAYLDEPERAREQQADDRDRRHEAYEDQRLTYPEKGLHE